MTELRRISRWLYQSDTHQVIGLSLTVNTARRWKVVRRDSGFIVGHSSDFDTAKAMAIDDAAGGEYLTQGHGRVSMVEETEHERTPEMAETPDTPKFNMCQCLSLYEERQTDNRTVRVHYSCGETIPRRRRFKPGHDAKLKSVLLRTFRAGDQFIYAQDGIEHSVDPLSMAKELGWEQFMTKAKVRQAKASKAETKTEVNPETDPETLAGFHPARVKVGRWWKDGHIVQQDDETVTVRVHDGKGKPKDHTLPKSSDKLEVG